MGGEDNRYLQDLKRRAFMQGLDLMVLRQSLLIGVRRCPIGGKTF